MLCWVLRTGLRVWGRKGGFAGGRWEGFMMRWIKGRWDKGIVCTTGCWDKGILASGNVAVCQRLLRKGLW